MADLAVLGFKADTSQLVPAKKVVEDLGKAAKETAKASDELAKGTKKASDVVSGAYGRLSIEGKKAVDAALSTKGALFQLDAAATSAGDSVSLLSRALSMLKTVAAALGLALGLRQYQQLADTWSDLNSRVGLAIQNMDGAGEVMGRLQQMARRTYSPLQMTAESFIANSTALRELGLNTNQQLDYTEALNNAFVVSGAKGDRAASVSNALSKAMAGGALRGDELNTVIQTGGRVAELLAEKLGTTTTGLRKLGSDGKITSDIIYGSLVGSMQKLRDEADSMPATIGDSFVLIQNSLLAAVGTFDQITGISANVASAFIFVADSVSAIGSVASIAALAIMDLGSTLMSMLPSLDGLFGGLLSTVDYANLAASAVAALATVLVGQFAIGVASVVLPAVVQLVIALGTSIVAAASSAATSMVLVAGTTGGMGVAAAAATTAFVALRGVLASLGIPLLVAGVAALIYGMQELSKNVGGAVNAWALMKAAAGGALSYVAHSLAAAASEVAAWANTVAAHAVLAGSGMLLGILPAINKMIGAFVGAGKAIGIAFQAVPAVLADAIRSAANLVISGVEQMVNKAIDGINKLITGASWLLEKAGMGGLETINKVELGTVALSGAAKQAAQDIGGVVSASMETTYVGNGVVTSLFDQATGYMNAATAARQAAAGHREAAASGLAATSAVVDLVRSTDESAEASTEATTAMTDFGNAAEGAGGKAGKGGKKAADGAKGAQKASEDLLAQIHKELGAREKLIGLSGAEEQRMKATQAVISKLGDSVNKYTKAAVQGAIDRTIAVENEEKRWEDYKSKVEGVATKLSDAFGDFVTRGFRDFKGFATAVFETFTDLIKQMIATAAKNRIMIALGIAPVGAQAGVPGTGGGGILSGFLGKALGSFKAPAAGGLLGGMGGVWSGITPGWASGGLGGALSGGLGATVSGISSGLSAGGIAGITSAIGAAIPIVAGVAAVVSIGKKLFGRKLKDTGIEATFDMAEGLAARTYKFYKGGLFRSNKTTRNALDPDVANPLSSAFGDMKDNVLDMVKVLGFGTDAVANFNYAFKFSTKGLSEDEIQRRLEEELTKFGSALAEGAVGGLQAFLKEGESAFEGLTRLSQAFTAANTAMDMLGKTLFTVGLTGADAASKLADLFGGVENMTGAISSYFSKFYSAEEQREFLLRSTTKALKDANMAMPTTRNEYRRMVSALDLSTESGRKAFATLVGLADAMDRLLPAAAGLSVAMNAAVVNVGSAIDAQIDYAKSMVSEMRKLASDWYAAAKSLRVTIGRLYEKGGASEAEKLQLAARNYRVAIDAAKAGDLEAAKNVGGLAEVYVEQIRANAKTQQDFARRESAIRSELGLVAGIAELTGASKDVQAQLYENMIDVLGQLKTFLSMQGVGEEALAQFGSDVQALYANFDDTIAGFEQTLDSLSSAIEHVGSMSYQALVNKLEVNVDVITAADLPAEIKQLLYGANNGIRASIDFMVRTDLAPDMKWLALTQYSEHAKTIEMLVGKRLPDDIYYLAMTNVASLLKTVNFTLGADISDEHRRIALATSSELARTVNVHLANSSDPAAIRLGLHGVHEAVTRTFNMLVNTGYLTPQQLNLLNAITGTQTGMVMLGGSFQFDPSGAFQSWYGETTRALMTNPMLALRDSLTYLRGTIAHEAAVRQAAAQREAALADAQSRLAHVKTLQNNHIAHVNNGINGIWSLASAYNVDLKTEKNGPQAWFKVDETGRFQADYDAIGGSGNRNAFKAAFHAPGGVWEQTYGQAGALSTLATQVEAAREAVRALGGVPSFAAGGMHVGGLRIVGEQGPELEATGPSRVWNANRTSDLLGGSGMAQELRALREEVQRLRDETVSAQIQVSKNTRRTADALRKWDIDGQPPERTEGEVAA